MYSILFNSNIYKLLAIPYWLFPNGNWLFPNGNILAIVDCLSWPARSSTSATCLLRLATGIFMCALHPCMVMLDTETAYFSAKKQGILQENSI